ncbi:MAG: hypothetical protein IJT37_07325 [Lachnospiraceae bacterium]|nr:hypothetical protein [Lachnospiraceae bacterium]
MTGLVEVAIFVVYSSNFVGGYLQPQCLSAFQPFTPIFLMVCPSISRRALDTGETEYLATNNFDEEITPSMFRELYFLRWACEKKYYELKITSLLEEFSSATPNSMMQEFFITLLLTNLSALVKADADEEIKNKSRPKNKFNYQTNRIFLFCHIKLNLIA